MNYKLTFFTEPASDILTKYLIFNPKMDEKELEKWKLYGKEKGFTHLYIAEDIGTYDIK